MRSKIISKKTILIASFLGFAVFVVFLLYFISKNSTLISSVLFGKNALGLSKQEQTILEMPVLLKIPSINVDALVENVGLTSDGSMDSPKGPNEVGWFDIGPRPGAIGSAVIAGHYGWRNNIPAVFDDLYTMKIGDKIYIIDEHGKQDVFVVRDIKIFDKDDDATSVFSSNDGGRYLNLITCSGLWSDAEKTRPQRLVVFSEKEQL